MKLQSMRDWESVEDDQDGLELAKLIRDILHQKDEKEQSALESVDADKALFLCYQKAHQTTAEYVETFKARVDVCKSTSGGAPGNYNAIAASIATSMGIDYEVLPDEDKKKEIQAMAEKRYLSALLFAGLDDGRYSKLKNDVRNNWIVGRRDTVPTSYDEVLRMADGYRAAGQTKYGGAGDGVAFAQAGRGGRGNPRAGRGGRGAGRGGSTQKKTTDGQSSAGGDASTKPPKEILANRAGKPIECWHCGGNHRLADCDKADFLAELKATINAVTSRVSDAETYLEELTIADLDDDDIGGVSTANCTPSLVVDVEPGVAFVGGSERERASPPRGTLDLTKAYLDSAASHHQIVRAADLSGVRTVNGMLRSDCNAGSTYSNQKGYLGDLDMWLNGGGNREPHFHPPTGTRRVHSHLHYQQVVGSVHPRWEAYHVRA